MELIDEDDIKIKRNKTKNTKKKLIILIILLSIVSLILIGLILVKFYSTDKMSVYIDGRKIPNLQNIFDFQVDENGKTNIYIPIKDIAPYLGYNAFDGEYNKISEDKTVCHVVDANNKLEVAIFTLNSNTIYKLNLEEKNSTYDYYNMDKTVFESNGKLYSSVEGIKQGFNVEFQYNEDKKSINIYTLPYLVSRFQTALSGKKIGNIAIKELDDKLENQKALFDGMAVVKSEDRKYGVIDINDYSTVLQLNYDNIKYIQYSSDFLVQANGQVALTARGENKSRIQADEIVLMDRDAKLYKIKVGNTYGVVDEKGKTIIHTEYDQIGIDISNYSYNGIKNGYIILNSLIPVKKGNMWGFYNTSGKMISQGFIYSDIGSKVSNANNMYSILTIPDYNIVVVQSNKKYSFIDTNGNDKVLPYGFIFDSVFIKIENGQEYYKMVYNGKDWDVIEYLQKAGAKKVQKE